MAYLDYTGLQRFWEQVKNRLDNKVDKSEGQSDWSVDDATSPSYIKNRTHYDTILSKTLFNGTITATAGKLTRINSIPDEMIVNYPDVSVVRATFDGKACTITATTNKWELRDPNGQLVFTMNYDTAKGAQCLVSTYAGSGAHTLVIEADEVTAVPLDEKYIPDTIPRRTDIPKMAMPDWNASEGEGGYVKNRTHYEEKNVIIPNTIIDVPSSDLFAALPVLDTAIVAGNSYVVELDNEKYTCVAWADGDVIYLGNGNVYPGVNKGENVPFSIDTYPDKTAFLNTQVGKEYVVSIATPGNVKQLDEKFIPDSVKMPKTEESYKQLVTNDKGEACWKDCLAYDEYGVIVPETEVSFYQNQGVINGRPAKIPEAGETCSINWNNIEYECEAHLINVMGLSCIAFGNSAAIRGAGFEGSGLIETNDPFAIIIVPETAVGTVVNGDIAIINLVDSNPVQLSISGIVNTHQIKERYIPIEKTHWINKEEEILLGTTILTQKDTEDQVNYSYYTKGFFNLPLTLGQDYIIEYNGNSYTGIVTKHVYYETAQVMVIAIDEKTGLIYMSPELAIQNGAQTNIYFHTTDVLDSITIKVSKPAGSYHSLDERYIPKSITRNVKDGLNSGSVYTSKAYSDVGSSAFACGERTHATGNYSHSEGTQTCASGSSSHAEGNTTYAEGDSSHSEGSVTFAIGACSHAEGNHTKAISHYSHAQGKYNLAEQYNCIRKVEKCTLTLERREYCTVIKEENNTPIFKNGKYCIPYEILRESAAPSSLNNDDIIVKGTELGDVTEYYHLTSDYTVQNLNGTNYYRFSADHYVYDTYIFDDFETMSHIVGNGTGEYSRSNAHTLDLDGNAWFAGDVYVGSTEGRNKDSGSKKLATEDYVNSKIISEETINEKIAELIDSAPETLNTLNELAAALGDDPNFATTIATQIGELEESKVEKIAGKGLSTNDYTTADKTLLNTIAEQYLTRDDIADLNTKIEAAHSHATTYKGSAFANGLYKITTNAEGHVTGATAVAKADITALGIPAQDTDTGATSVEVTGAGNAITAASYDATSRKLTLTKGATYTNNQGTITGVNAGTSLSGGGTSGAISISHAEGSAINKIVGLYKFATDATSHVKSVTAVNKADIVALGIPAQDTTYSAITNNEIDAICGQL